jgi:hypothetical protein
MPVRKIPKNHLVVTGSFASRKNAQMADFESLLEKEHLLLLEFDDTVERFETQPITIPVPNVPKGYTPDVLVHYLPDSVSGNIRKSLLCEVKHTDDLHKNANKYAPKFAAAEQYAEQHGWEFCVRTQRDIRIPRLANLKFLREYRNIEPDEQDLAEIIRLLKRAGGTITLQTALDQAANNDDERLYWLPIIWNLVLIRRLTVDFDIPFGHDMPLHFAMDKS